MTDGSFTGSTSTLRTRSRGTWATLRLLFQLPDGALQIVDVVVSHVDGTTTAEERAGARTWLERQVATSTSAVTFVLPPALTKS